MKIRWDIWKTLYLLVMLLLLAFIYYELGMMQEENNQQIAINVLEKCEVCKMCGTNKIAYADATLGGVFHPTEKYYCVWTANRSIDQIANSEEHEMCHAMINTDYNHFCNIIR